MGKQELCTNISDDSTIINYTSGFSNKNLIIKTLKFKKYHRSKLTLFKNIITSKTSIENELIYSKKITDIQSRHKTEKITLESLKPDILCYNMQTPNEHGKHTQNNPKKSSKLDKKDDNKKSNRRILDPHHHYFLHDDHMQKETIHPVESNISREPITWKTSNMRLLHSKLRPDTSKTSNILLPNLDYTLSTEKLPKHKYPKNVPPPVFKEVGSYKGSISIMTSKERLLQRERLEKEQKKLEKERKEAIDATQPSKFLKQKENTQYDIIFGGKHLKGITREYDDDKLPESQNKKKSATRRVLERFRKVPSRSESEIELIAVESSLLIAKSSPINLFIEDDDEDSEIEEPEDESEESEEDSEEESEDESQEDSIESKEESKEETKESKEESEEELKQKSDGETNKIQLELMEPEEKELLSKDYFKEKPKRRIKSEESPIKVIDKKEIPIKMIHHETKSIKPEINKRLVIFKECDGKLCTYGKNRLDKVCEKLMLNIGTSISQKGQTSVEVATSTHVPNNTKAFPIESLLSRRCPNYNHMDAKTVPGRNPKLPPNYVTQDLRNPIYNRSEMIEHELQVFSINSCPNRSTCGQLSRSTKNLKKSAYDSREKLYEKELQNYDYLTNRVSQISRDLTLTEHKILLDLNYQNKVTQTRHFRKKEKNMQTYNDFPSKQNALQVANHRGFKIVRKTPMGIPQWVIINHPIGHQSQLLKPNTDMIYKNIKYRACPKYGKTINPHGNPQRISVNNRKHSYNNNLQYNISYIKNYRMFTYFVNVHQKPKDNLEHSLNLKTVDRNLFIKFV